MLLTPFECHAALWKEENGYVVTLVWLCPGYLPQGYIGSNMPQCDQGYVEVIVTRCTQVYVKVDVSEG